MALGKTHLVSADAITLAGIDGLQIINNEPVSLTITLALMAGTSIGALLPDIDSKSSIISKTPFFNLISPFFHHFVHRGWTHTLWFAMIPLFFVYELMTRYSWAGLHFVFSHPQWADMFWQNFWKTSFAGFNGILLSFCLGIFIGIILHLITDNLSYNGICFFYPLGHYEIKTYTTESHAGNRTFVHKVKSLKKKRRFSSWRYRVGGGFERLMFRIFQLLLGFLIVLYVFVK